MKNRITLVAALATMVMYLQPQPSQAGSDVTLRVRPAAQEADAANAGLVYTLPSTVLRIKLQAYAVVSSVGPFFQYSSRLLNAQDVVTENKVEWTLVGAQVQTVGAPDYTKMFVVSATNPADLPSLAFSPDGVLHSVNADPQSPDPQTVAPYAPIKNSVSLPPFASFADAQLPQTVLTRTSKAAMAEECAKAIFALRDNRLDLLSGAQEAQMPDAGAMEQTMAHIARLEQKQMELFVGHRDTVWVDWFVDIVPDYNGAANLVPVRFSQSAGFVDAMDLTGKPIYVDFEFDDRTHVNAIPETSKERAKAPLSGLRYMIPGLLTVRVLDRNVLLTQQTVECTQNGQIATLPASMLQTHKLTFSPATGRLLSVVKIPNSNSVKK